MKARRNGEPLFETSSRLRVRSTDLTDARTLHGRGSRRNETHLPPSVAAAVRRERAAPRKAQGGVSSHRGTSRQSSVSTGLRMSHTGRRLMCCLVAPSATRYCHTLSCSEPRSYPAKCGDSRARQWPYGVRNADGEAHGIGARAGSLTVARLSSGSRVVRAVGPGSDDTHGSVDPVRSVPSVRSWPNIAALSMCPASHLGSTSAALTCRRCKRGHQG